MFPLLIKIDICGDKMETRIFEEFWHFTAQENGAILVATCHCFAVSVCGSLALHSSAFSGLPQAL